MSMDKQERERADRSFGYAKSDQRAREAKTANQAAERLARRDAGESLKVEVRRRNGIVATDWVGS